MNAPRYLVTLTVLNIGALFLSFAQQALPVSARKPTAVLRTHALEILPASTSSSGVTDSETVLLRLITEQGRPSVKISASEETSGLSVTGPTGTKDAYAILEANATASLLKLRAEDGREQTLRP